MSPREEILVARSLRKRFGKVEAVKGVSLTVRQGQCFGLLGPNGAGKSTTLEIMEGLTDADSGEVYFKGRLRRRDHMEEVGIQFQETSLPDYLKTREVLNLFGSFYAKTLPQKEVIDFCNLGDFLERDVHVLSGGQRQRVLLALALLHDPELIFLDEPTTGLDPGARRDFWNLVHRLKAKGKTLILTTHYMEEAQALCDEIAIMNKGEILLQGSPQRLLAQTFKKRTILVPTASLSENYLRILQAELDLEFEATEEGQWKILTTDPNTLLMRLVEKKVSLSEMAIRSPNLDDLFLHMTQNSESPAKGAKK